MKYFAKQNKYFHAVKFRYEFYYFIRIGIK